MGPFPIRIRKTNMALHGGGGGSCGTCLTPGLDGFSTNRSHGHVKRCQLSVCPFQVLPLKAGAPKWSSCHPLGSWASFTAHLTRKQFMFLPAKPPGAMSVEPPGRLGAQPPADACGTAAVRCGRNGRRRHRSPPQAAPGGRFSVST